MDDRELIQGREFLVYFRPPKVHFSASVSLIIANKKLSPIFRNRLASTNKLSYNHHDLIHIYPLPRAFLSVYLVAHYVHVKMCFPTEEYIF